MADASPQKNEEKTDAKTSEKTAEQRARAHVDQLLARPAARSPGVALVGGQRQSYTAEVAFMPVRGEVIAELADEPQAAVMTTAYCLDRAAPASRPVCFAFNGGPGSASIWLHLGALGPKRIVVPDDGSLGVGPYAVQDNPQSWFEHFDLVFIDPPHTGWSASASEKACKKMLSLDGDVAALAEVVRVWLARHQRWGSQVYLAGESRACGRRGFRGRRPCPCADGRRAARGPRPNAHRAPAGVSIDQRFEVLNRDVGRGWNWNRGDKQGNDYTTTSVDLARALRRHSALKVLAASGRHDLGTPYSASDWSLAQLDVPLSVRTRVTHRYYDAGHMMYTRRADLMQLKADLAAWLQT